MYTKYDLRATPIVLADEDEEKIIREKGFFNIDINPEGKGISHKYELINDGKVIYDAATELAWQQSGSESDVKFKEVECFIETLNRDVFAGCSDWRLPTFEEAMSLMEPDKDALHIDSLFDCNQRHIWTSDKSSEWGNWTVSFYGGRCNYGSLDDWYSFIRVVRSVL